MKKRYFVCGISFILFLVILVSILMGRTLFIDGSIREFILGIRTDLLTKIFKVLTIIGDKKFILCLVILLAGIFYFKKNRNNAIIMCANLFNIVILNKGIKYLVKRERPLGGLVEEDGYSFPSGHSMLTIGVYGLLIYLIYKSNIKSSTKKILITLLTIIILVVGLSRMYLGVHYPSDVIGGYLITLAYLILFAPVIGTVIDKFFKKLKK